MIFEQSNLYNYKRQFFVFLNVNLRIYYKTFMKNALYLSSLMLLCFCACKKEKDAEPTPAAVTPTSTTNYYPLTVGSYWIYERFQMDTNGIETVVSVDSSYISGDTIINGDTFTVFVGTFIDPAGIYCRRDSAGYILDQYGVIQFSSTNYTDTLRVGSTPGYYTFFYKMISPVNISTPAGTFLASDFLATINITQPGYLWDTTRYIHNYYSDGIGLIRETAFFLSNPNYDGRRLVRYQIQ